MTPFLSRLGIFLLAAVAATACNRSIYVVDGVTDGDTFYLAEYVHYEDDPVLQSWVAFSLDLSTCQLSIGGENPARNTSFDCEHGAHETLVETWREQRDENASRADEYLDALALIEEDGFLAEYVVDHFVRRGWQLPESLDMRAYRRYRKANLRRLAPERRIIGSWNYAYNRGGG